MVKERQRKREGERNIGMLCYLYTEMKESLRRKELIRREKYDVKKEKQDARGRWRKQSTMIQYTYNS